MNKVVRNLDDLTEVGNRVNHVLTLFSGGLDSTYVLSILASLPCKVTALVVDVGDDIDKPQLQTIAEHFNANLVVVDSADEFAYQAVIPAIQAQAKYLGIYPVSSSLSRPIIAYQAVKLANELHCDAIIHTANQSQNSLRRLNGAIERSGYSGYYGTPYEYSAISRKDKTDLLTKAGMKGFEKRAVSGDNNLWCREFESGLLDNPEQFNAPEELYQWSKAFNPNKQITQPHDLDIVFTNGVPIAINNQALPLVELIKELNILVGSYGIGRYAGLEHLENDEKVLEVREAPAAHILMDAYRHLETAILHTDVIHQKLMMEQIWCQEAVNGRWDSSLQRSCAAFIKETAVKINGTVKYSLKPGYSELISIIADTPLYLTDRDSWEIEVANLRSQRSIDWSNSNLQLAKIA